MSGITTHILDTSKGRPAANVPITLSRLSSRFMALNSSLRLEQAVALAQSRSAEVAFDARTRRDLLFNVAMRSMDWLEGQPGRHSLLMVSGGFARDPGDVRFNQIVTRSLRVNAPIHFLDARGLQGISRFDGVEFAAALPPSAGEAPFAFSDAAGGSTGLADDTGGITIRNTNDMAKGLGRVLETMTTYYLLSYEPPAHTKPGFRKITVEARAKGLHVRARRGYVDPAVPTR